jgi:LacI family transcriptional regulator
MIIKPRVTLHDVAALAGVSHQTVSRVINKSANVRPETLDRVNAAILELGYRPNAIARSMVRGITRTLGCISPNLTDPVFTRIIESAQTEARRQGFFILIGSAGTVDEFRPLLDELLNRRVDGLIIINARDDNRYQFLQPVVKTGSPIVFVKNSPGEDPVSAICCDDVRGGYLATKHLLDLGHRKIAIILGRENEQCTGERLEGYRSALRDFGITPPGNLILQGDWSPQSGNQAAARLLQEPDSFSAIFAQNDRMAAGAIRALQEAGYQVPGDYSVVGYDNLPLASLITPPLTTIEQPLDYFGQQAAAILIKSVLKGDLEPVEICAEPQLIVRESSASLEAWPSGSTSKEVMRGNQ